MPYQTADQSLCAFAMLETLEPRLLLTLLDPSLQPKFVNELPIPAIMQPTIPGGTHYEVSITQFQQDLGLVDPATGQHLLTTVWGYNGSYPGATFEVRKDQAITVHWTNNLVDDQGNPLPHLLPVDTSIHWADPANYPASGVPVVTHLHGGHNESASDGLPEAWFTPGFGEVGPDWVKETYTYTSDQDATTLWYHDHALGITRLNVYAGLAGFYIIRDAAEDALNLPSGEYEIPLVIQDRMFTDDGQLFYPSEPQTPQSPDPSVEPEFFGDTILVNGEAWPVLDVEPRKYRFRILNGSDSRFYQLAMSNGMKITQIGSDGGLLNSPVPQKKLLIAPAERYDVVIDFSRLSGKTIVMRNTARGPFPDGDKPDRDTQGQIMAFRVSKPLSSPDTSTVPKQLRAQPIQRITQADVTRPLVLMELTDEFGRLETRLGTVRQGGLLWEDPVTETPRLNTTEIWEFYNTTMDAHPIHLHQVQFQVLNQQAFKADVDLDEGQISNIRLRGKAKGPTANNAGFKDTIIVPPGQVVRVIATWDLPGKYVWHCHILSHEDHDMMRPVFVMTPPDGGNLMSMSLEPGLLSGSKTTLSLSTGNSSPRSAPAINFAVPASIGVAKVTRQLQPVATAAVPCSAAVAMTVGAVGSFVPPPVISSSEQERADVMLGTLEADRLLGRSTLDAQVDILQTLLPIES